MISIIAPTIFFLFPFLKTRMRLKTFFNGKGNKKIWRDKHNRRYQHILTGLVYLYNFISITQQIEKFNCSRAEKKKTEVKTLIFFLHYTKYGKVKKKMYSL